MTNYTWNGAAGSYLDPAQWAGGVVPLWDEGSTVVIAGGTATLQDVAPNNMTVEIGGPSFGGAAPRLVLDNAALGPGLDVRVTSAVPVGANNDAGAVVVVQGYDTNYGTIEMIHDQATVGSSSLGFTIQPHSQLNNEGTITEDSTISAATGSRGATMLFLGGGYPTTAVLNNDGQINVLNDSTAAIYTAMTGTGVITLARTTGAEANALPNLIFTEGQVAASQSVTLEAGQMTLYQELAAPQLFGGVISDWNPAARVYLPGQAATSLQFTQTTAAQGDLVVSSDNGGRPYAYDLKVAGQHTTDQFSFQPQPGPYGSVAGTYVSISA